MEDVKSPSHYTQGKIEVIDFIKDQKLNYCEGNIIKYICRYKFKGDPVKDLMKARQYIDFLLEEVASEAILKSDYVVSFSDNNELRLVQCRV